MELIKKVKEAEQQAQQIIEQAKTEIAKQAEESREHRRQVLEEAEQGRKKAITDAVAQAEAQAQQEVENLKVQAEKQRQELWNKAEGRKAGAVAKVVDRISIRYAEHRERPNHNNNHNNMGDSFQALSSSEVKDSDDILCFR
jgi:V/A-type H+-transporting ATPase subunit G/H